MTHSNHKEEVENTPTDKMMVPNYTLADIEEIKDQMLDGNIPAALRLILHNQRIINDKLNQLLK